MICTHQVLEATPTRRLGLSAFQRRFGLTPRPPEAELRDTTWLARTPEPWAVEGHIAYDVTHNVFHLTDWGERPDGLPPGTADYLATWLPVWSTTGWTSNAGMGYDGGRGLGGRVRHAGGPCSGAGRPVGGRVSAAS
ncbi:hypothetical protein QF034_008024 [Streptomyces africanus]|uniref:DUF6895 domain-containing protein n=1 Tax=Streptomyces africanus TaxID=231024 RepID=A0ABU0R2B9_9ACTN|nr:hypothetical protein [Streptomyces africanus]